MKSLFTDFKKAYLNKILFVISLSVFFLFSGAQPIAAQELSPQEINVDVNNAQISNVLSLIEKESSYRFLYNSDIKTLQQKVSLNITSPDIKELLKALFNNTNLTYTMMENNLIIVNEASQNATTKNNFAGDDRIITGKVTGNEGPLSGVSVQIRGTDKGVTTNAQGEYSINVSDSDILVFSYVGYETQELSVTGKATLDVTLILSKKEDLTQVVVVGYGTQRKIDVTGSISHVSGNELSKQPVISAAQAIQGKVAGVQVIGSGQPGSSPQVIIRGAGSILGGANPLYVVDGLVLPPGEDITNINSADILSIDVLKDASSAAIYGARAANGVILITTRQGSGKMKVNYNVNVGMNQAAYVVPMANATQYINYVENTTGLPVNSTGYNTNWYNQILRNAFYQDHNVSIAGGTDKNKYFFNVGYLADEGILIGNDYERYSVRFNNEFTPNTAIKVGTTLSYSNSISQSVPTDIADGTYQVNPTGSMTEDAYRAAPTVPAIINGKYGNTSQYQNVGNPVLDAYETNDLSHNNKILGNAYLEIKPIKSLTLRSAFGGEIVFYDDRRYTYEHPNDTSFFNVTGGSQGASRSTLQVTSTNFYDWSWDNTVNFNQTFGKSKLNALAGTTAEGYYSNGFTGTRYSVPPISSEWYLQSGDPNTAPPANSTTLNKINRVSYLGRVFYSYDDRFLVTGTFRADASSVFAPGNQWGYFPGISGGWVISKEKFMDKQHVFQNLKLRAGWGELGNSNIAPDAAFYTVYSGLGYFFNSGNTGGTQGGTTGGSVLQVKEQNIKWEINKEADIGLEYAILNNKVTGELDFYDKKTNNALIYIYVPGSFGSQPNPSSTIAAGYVLTNAASIENKGVEFSANYRQKVSSRLSYSIGGNVSYNQNKVVSLNGGSPYFDENINGTFVTETKTGYPIGSFFVRQVIGVFQNQAQINSYTDANGKPYQSGAQQGDLIFKYHNDPHTGAGILDTVFAGAYQPKFNVGLSGSINYKNFDFSVDIYSNFGNQVYNGKLQERAVATDNVEASVATSFWTPQNHSETQPRPNAADPVDDAASTYFISSGSFVRINNVTVGYTLSAKSLSKQNIITSCRIFLTAQNPYTYKKYNGFTSELPGTSATNSGVELNTYPTVRTFAAGANIGF